MSTGKPLSPVTVVNVRTNEGTSTNKNGLYLLHAKQGDIISFSYLGYTTAKKVTPPFVLVGTLNVELEPTEYQLKEYQVRPGLTQYQRDSIERTEIFKFPLQREHPTVMSPVSMIAEKFSHKARVTYQFQKDFAREEKEKFIATRYTRDVVTKVTGLKGDSIGYFIFACPMPYDFARVATDLELKMWIRSSYREWMKRIANQ